MSGRVEDVISGGWGGRCRLRQRQRVPDGRHQRGGGRRQRRPRQRHPLLLLLRLAAGHSWQQATRLWWQLAVATRLLRLVGHELRGGLQHPARRRRHYDLGRETALPDYCKFSQSKAPTERKELLI